MKKSYNIISLLSLSVCLSFGLTSCSYFDTGEDIEDANTVAEVTSVDQGGTGLPQDYAQSVAMRTKGSVQVYSLDPSAPQAAPVQENIVVSTKSDGEEQSVQQVEPVFAAPQTSPLSPSVQVFPLGGGQPAAAPMGQPQYQFQGQQSTGISQQALTQAGKAIIYFDYNSSSLDGEDLDQIAQLASMYRSGFAPNLSVEGHASSSAQPTSSSHAANLKVSMDRAFAVAKALMAAGVPADKISTKALGDSVPPPYGNGMSADETGRRVEIRTY